METYEIQIIESIALIIISIILVRILRKLIGIFGRRFSYAKGRVKVVKKVVSTLFLALTICILGLIWGIPPSQLAAYVGSLLTVLGLALLAQWSILSNITAAMIIFFNHQVNIGDSVEIIDKDYNVAGIVSNIGVFFILIKVNPNEYVSIPSIVFMQKMVKKIKNTAPAESEIPTPK